MSSSCAPIRHRGRCGDRHPARAQGEDGTRLLEPDPRARVCRGVAVVPTLRRPRTARGWVRGATRPDAAAMVVSGQPQTPHASPTSSDTPGRSSSSAREKAGELLPAPAAGPARGDAEVVRAVMAEGRRGRRYEAPAPPWRYLGGRPNGAELHRPASPRLPRRERRAEPSAGEEAMREKLSDAIDAVTPC